jgi:hypothetical protein
MRILCAVSALFLSLLLAVGCTGEPGEAAIMPEPSAGQGGSPGRPLAPAIGGRDPSPPGPDASLPMPAPPRQPGTVSDAGHAEGSNPGAPDPSRPTVPTPDAGATAPPGNGDGGGSGQGPIAEGRIVFSQDFEQNMDGFSPSPPSIPASRYQRVPDPLGQRGSVMRIVWESGDNNRTSANNKPRSMISNRGYEFPFGAKVSYAWGYLITSVDINATFAQHIRPGGPMWMLEGHNEGDLIVRCGGTTQLTKRLEPMRWYDFRVEVDYRPDGYVQVFIDDEKVYERRDNLGFQAPKNGAAHWDGGIYNTELGISRNSTRTVYLSNLSIGTK